MAVVALATLGAPAASAQTIEDRARTAAGAAHAKSADSETLQRNYTSPGLSGQPVSTVDNSRSFNPRISCRKTATLMEVLIQPVASGDIGSIQIARDTDFDGAIDKRQSLPVAASGICANGIVACQPGSWSSCHYFRWETGASGDLKLGEVSMSDLAGCYCINNSCGTNLAWGNMRSVLGDLGGGMVGALTTADPRIGVADAVIDGPVIRYIGAQSTACARDPLLPQTGYRTDHGAMASDAFAAARSSAVFQALSNSPSGRGTAQLIRRCTIERQFHTQSVAADDIIRRVSGGYSEVRGQNSIEWLMGSPGYDSLSGGNCRNFDFRLILHVGAADRIADARLVYFYYDDWAQIRIDGKLVLADPSSWTSTGLPKSKCERDGTWHNYPNLDLKPYLTPGEHEIWLRVAVGNRGEAFAQLQIELDTSCRFDEQLVDLCRGVEAGGQCRLDSESVDGVQTFRNGVNTGLRPLPQRRVLGSGTCPVEVTRDFFLKERSYRCTVDNQTVPQPDVARGAFIIDHSTETMLRDQPRRPDGSFSETSTAFHLPERGSVPKCEAICKTRSPRINNAAAPAGVVGTKQNDPTSYDIFYHSCGGGDACPLGPGEELVSGCGCLDDFPEAAVMMQAVRLAGADLVCTGAQR
jgi:hypothetical protein